MEITTVGGPVSPREIDGHGGSDLMSVRRVLRVGSLDRAEGKVNRSAVRVCTCFNSSCAGLRKDDAILCKYETI